MFRQASTPVSTAFRNPQIRVHHRLLAILAAGALLLVAGVRAESTPDGHPVIGGPLALLLASSTDLGSSRDGGVQLTVTLPDSARPQTLVEWAGAHRMSVRWRPGDAWAVVEGAAQDVALSLIHI